MTKDKLISTMFKAISHYEGWDMTRERWERLGMKVPTGWKEGDPLTISQRNNNPGNLRSWGDVPVVKGYAKFPTQLEGIIALKNQIEFNVFGKPEGSKEPFPLRKTEPMDFFEFFAGQRYDTSNVLRPGGYPGFAPTADRNHPQKYAEFVAAQVSAAVTFKVAATDVIKELVY